MRYNIWNLKAELYTGIIELIISSYKNHATRTKWKIIEYLIWVILGYSQRLES